MKILLLLIYASFLLWSAISPHDYFTWFLEVLPALIVLVVIMLTAKSFPLSNLLYILITLHCVILMVGGHYTYAEVPAFNWLRDTFSLSRNYYDRLGHFMQGFVPAIAAREVIIRRSPLKSGGWLSFFAFSFCGLVTVCYELFEYFVAKLTGEQAEAFLGTQGDVWDTQSDMLCCLIGAAASLLLLRNAHDRSLQSIVNNNSVDFLS